MGPSSGMGSSRASLGCWRRTSRALLLLLVAAQISQAERLWRRERGTRALNQANQHLRQEGTALVAVMVCSQLSSVAVLLCSCFSRDACPLPGLLH